MKNFRIEPKLYTVLFRERYTLSQFSRDLVAGVLVGIVALPLSIALAIASGVKPEQGIYTAVIAGFLISALGGSRVQIGGPTGAFIVLVYNTVQQFGYGGLAVATMLAGGLLLVMGLLQFGSAIKFIPYPVTVGFTCGIAVLIATTQVRDLLGLEMPPPPAEFHEKIIAYASHISTINPHSVGLAAAAFAIILFWPRVTRRVPGSLIAILILTPLVIALDLPVETIRSRFGSVPTVLPAPSLPDIDWRQLPRLFQPAFAIAMLGGIESLLSAVVADGMTGRRHRSNTELVAQGIANVASPLFLGIPATGAIARTATNIRNGGQTPVAGMVHAATLLAIMLVFGKWAVLIPMPILAAILLKVAMDMGEWRLLIRLLGAQRGDALVMVSTFLLTVFADLTVAIGFGVVMASFLFMHRMAEATQIGIITDEVNGDELEDDPNAIQRRVVPDGVEVFEIYGPFFFGAADRFKDELRRIEKPPRVLILRMRHVPTIDATGLIALEDLFQKCQKEKTELVLSGVQSKTWDHLVTSGLYRRIGPENVHTHIDYALARAREIVEPAVSATC
ncbi:MAG: STAS domain-containing protein [Verrucomicrobia bacterium]|nr:STAS domain-containing protein [Verrucomicrobiota bacterium]